MREEHAGRRDDEPAGHDRTETELEAWLLDLGLRAMQVESCPVPDCEVCYPAVRESRPSQAA